MTQGQSGGEGEPSVTMGSAADCDVVFEVRVVSGRHARILWDGKGLVIEDLGSTNGTTVNGVKVERGPVAVGDTIGFGSHRFKLSVAQLAGLEAQGVRLPLSARDARRMTTRVARPTLAEVQVNVQERPTPGRTGELMGRGGGAVEVPSIPATAKAISIGYADDNDVVIPIAQVSGHHCRLWKDGPRFIIEDLGSTNGTWIGDRKVRRALVTPGETLSLGSYQVKLTDVILARFEVGRTPIMATSVGKLPAGLLKPIKIGRDPTPGVNDIALDAPMVSNEHCEIQLRGTSWRVTDLGSTNGTYINNTHNRITEAVAVASDVLFFGSYRFPLSRLSEFIPDAGGRADEMTLPKGKETILIGRDASCDMTLDAPQISRQHARLRRVGGAWLIEDLKSANGTFVNGKRVTRATITADDWVSLGSYQLKFDLDAGTVARSYHGDIMIQAENVTVKVDKGRKAVLHNISFTVYPTEFVGLMGPSGAGKTTLMMALNGYMPPAQGRSLINGQELYANYNAFRGNIGYVPQDDIIHSALTVWEALYYTARLRLPPDTGDDEIEAIIKRVLTDLEIEDTRDVLIGSPEKKGISGGQRKRVNLAQELLTQPSLLFLDEPTSGLASEDALNVMKLLRRLADEGRTILLTIHQPSLEAYRTMDNVVYLADGHLVYYGPAWPDSITFFNPDAEPGTPDGDRVLSDPGSAMRPLAADRRKGHDMVTRARNYIDSRYFQEYVQRRRNDASGAILTGGDKRRTRRRFALRQWWLLTRRYFTIKLKDTANTTILLLQAPIIAAIIVLVFRGELQETFGRVNYEPVALFMMAISAVWFGCSNAAREIVSEQAIFRRERMVNLKLASYVLSKFTVLALLCAVQCATLLVTTHLGLDLRGNFLEMFLALLLCATSGVGMGLMLSAMTRSSEAAVALVPLLLIPQVILAGMIMPIDSLSLPMRAASTTMMTRWGFEALLHAEDRAEAFEITEADIQDAQEDFEDEIREKDRDDEDVNLKGVIPPVPIPTHPLDRYYESHEVGTLGDFGALLAFNLLMLLGVITTMKLRDPEVG